MKTPKKETKLAGDTGKLIEALKSALDDAGKSDRDTPGCDPGGPEDSRCEAPDANEQPEAVIRFRRPVPITPIRFRALEPEEQDHQSRMTGCFSIRDSIFSSVLALDLEFEQKWWFQKQVQAALSSTFTLSPNEKLRLVMQTSQRKHFEQSTLDEVEENDSTESKIIDRDVVNVTRSSTRTKNWNVSGSASVTIPIKKVDLGLNFGGSVSKSFTRSAQSAAEQVRESTKSSSDSLRTLQKIEVKESVETTEEYRRSRLITNPYRDRSLSLKVYGLAKKFCVEFTLARTRPVMIFEISNLPFTKSFVLANADFVEAHLEDARLVLELNESLEVLTDPAFSNALEEVEKLSRLALKYLFDKPNLFNVRNVSGVDANLPSSSFDAQLSKAGLDDAVKNKVGIILTTLNYYYDIYKNEAPLDESLYLSLALSLDSMLRPLWLAVEEPDKVLDEKHLTEIFRRLSGFLSLIAGSVRPLLHPAEEDRERIEMSRRAEFVVGRVVNHLNCHRLYYIGRYLSYISSQAGGIAFRTMIEDLMEDAGQPTGLKENWAELFSTEEAFVNSNQIIVPASFSLGKNGTQEFLEKFDKAEDIKFGLLDTSEIFAPTDGFHVEPTTGGCILAEVPSPEELPAIRIAIDGDEDNLFSDEDSLSRA